MEQFALGEHGSALQDAVIDGLERYNGMARQLINDEAKFSQFASVVLPMIYERLRGTEAGGLQAP
jgi:hypothetical protein